MQPYGDMMTATADSDMTTRRSVPKLLAGTMVSTDLDAARAFYEGFLGLDCVRYAKDGLLIRDQISKAEMEAGGEDFFVIDVQKVDVVENPQRMLHHWGVDVVSGEEVDRIHALAKARKEEFGLKKLFPVSDVHGAHSFYFADRDMNWWEIEYRIDGLDNEAMIHGGDQFPQPAAANGDLPGRTVVPMVADPRFATPAVVTNAHLTHGTCEQSQLEGSQRFLKAVLGLRCVRHLEPAQIIAGAGQFGVFGIRTPRVLAQGPENRWVIAVDGEDAVEAIADRARSAADELGLLAVETRPEGRFGRSCLIQDADGNWWEAAAMDVGYFQDRFARGDAATLAA
ncbi:MAG: hypothetical protein JWR80_1209 [Bradyrhizobium sp.]|nr:hypothetical protein [Bradyrhizobium sp.]